MSIFLNTPLHLNTHQYNTSKYKMSIQDTEKLKGLKRQLSKAEGEYDALKIEVSNIQKQCSEKKILIQSLNKEIESLNVVAPIQISDHAIVRYAERVLGWDIEQMKSDMLPASIYPLVEKLGTTGTYPSSVSVCGNTRYFQIVMKDNNVTTIKT